jgi:hypothetical protein
MSEGFLPSPVSTESAPVPDRRVRVRHARRLHTYAQRGHGELDQFWWMGSVRNISRKGVGLTLQHWAEPGTRLTLEVENSSRATSVALQVEVVRIVPQPGGWYLGCVFIPELSDADLQALLR